MKRLIVTLCLIGMWSVALASIAIKIDPPTISIAETVRVTLTFDNAQNHGIPDLMPLLRDFTVLSTERSISYTAINGQARSISQWSMVLKPKRIGILPIPPIRIGQEQSLPSQITVNNQSPSNIQSEPKESIDSASDTLLTAEVNETKPYINQQVIYTVKLFNRQRLLDAQYQAPQVDDALLIPLGEGRHYQTQLKGESFDVEEQQYALFPQKRGELRILPPSFNALVYDGFSPTRVSLQAKPITLNVEPLPSNQTTNNWLPSNQVNLTESYDQTEPTAQEGTTIVRTINLQAAGLVSQLLPILTFANSEQFSVYPDKPTTQNELRQGELWGNATIQVTYLLTKPGTVTLPAVLVPWYNIVTKQHETATLPVRIVQVKPKTGSAPTIKTPKQPTTSQTIFPKSSKIRFPKVLWIGATIILLSIIPFILWWSRSKTNLTRRPNSSSQELHDACKSNDPSRVRVALIAWATKQWPTKSILNLNDIPIRNDAFKKQLERLSVVLYGQHSKTTWTGDELWQCITSMKPKNIKPKKQKTTLPPIYLN